MIMLDMDMVHYRKGSKMANKQISQLTAKPTAVASTDQFGIDDTSSDSYKITVANLQTYFTTLYLTLSGGTLTGNLILNGNPSSALMAATKQYVDAVASGLNVHDSCVSGTVAALTVVYNNGALGVGATLTNNGAQAALALDGITASLNDRILVKDQAAPAQNGIYTATTLGSGAINWVITRATDMDEAAEFQPGDFVLVLSGTVNGKTQWVQTATVATVGTDAVTWDQFGADINALIVAIQDNSYTYIADTGAADAYAAVLVPAVTAYVAGLGVYLNVANDNTGPCTLDVNARGVKNIKLADGTDPSAKDILSSQIAHLIYDGTNFVLQNPCRLQTSLVVTGTSDVLEVNRPFVSNNAASVALTLPATAKVGDLVIYSGLGAGGWNIVQAASQIINSPGGSTTAGVTGSITSTNRYDSMVIRCVVADTTFVVESMIGAPTFA